MNDERTKALIHSLETQRNAAFNALANTEASLAVALAENARLRQAIEQKSPTDLTGPNQ